MNKTSSLTRDIPSKALALVLALAIWAVAMGEKHRTTASPRFDMVVQATVVARNLDKDLVLTSAPPAVTMRLRGPKELETAAADSTVAYMDLAGRGDGEHVVAVEPDIPPGVELVRMSDNRVKVTLERRVRAVRKVEVSVSAPSALGEPAAFGISAVSSPADATIEGAESAVAGVDRLVAMVMIDGHREGAASSPETDASGAANAEPAGGEEGPLPTEPVSSLEVVAPVIAIDSMGEAVTDVTVYPQTVTVSVELTPWPVLPHTIVP